MPANTVVIWNTAAGSASAASEARRQLEQLPGVEVRETDSNDRATELARDVAPDTELVVAAGGDGTINAVINGLVSARSPAALGLIPLGTGNSLCRALAIPLDPLEAVGLLQSGQPQAIDLVRLQSKNQDAHFACVASGGNSDRVLQNIASEDKQRWGPWVYLRSALPVLSELIAYEATLQFDDQPPEKHSLWNVLVANSTHAAGGMVVAPRADLTDGLMDVMLILDGTPLDLAALTTSFFLGDYLEDERVIFRHACSLRIEATPELNFLADGETFSGQPFTFTTQPAAIRVIVGETKT